MSEMPQVIYVAAGAEQAHLLANALRDRGIKAFVTNDGLQLGGLPFGLSTAPRVVVPESDAMEARRIALELLGEAPESHRPFQFRMRTVFYAVTALSVYLAIDRASGWGLSKRMPLFLGIFKWFLLIVIVLTFRRKRSE